MITEEQLATWESLAASTSPELVAVLGQAAVPLLTAEVRRQRDAIGHLVEAAEAAELGGQHEGPCTNADDPWDSCERHIAAATRRNEHLARVVQTARQEHQ